MPMTDDATALALLGPDEPAPTGVIVLMTPAEAGDCVQRIRASAQSTRALVRDLYHRQGWRALGYPDWLSCVRAELDGASVSHAYRIRDAVEIQQQIAPAGPEIPEAVLRSLKKAPPLLRKPLYERAQEDAGKQAPSSREVAATIAAAFAALGETPPALPTLKDRIRAETAAASEMGKQQMQDRQEGRFDARRSRVVGHLQIAEKGCVALQEQVAELACRLALAFLRGSDAALGVWGELYVLLGPPPADSIPATEDEPCAT